MFVPFSRAVLFLLLAMPIAGLFAMETLPPQPTEASRRDDTSSSGVYSGRCTRVVDGDSLYIEGVDKQIRLWGVDAPERDEAGYERARKQLTQLALKQVLRCEQQDTDKYGRIVARCYRDGDLELNAEQIQTRVAEEYCRFTRNYYGFCH